MEFPSAEGHKFIPFLDNPDNCRRCGSHRENHTEKRTRQSYDPNTLHAEIFRREAAKRPDLHWQQEGGYEILSEPLYDTVFIHSGVTTEARFFGEVKHSCLSNILIPNALPSPQSFLITGIQLYGITAALGFGVFEFTMANKRYGSFPAWRLAIRERYRDFHPIYIPPMCYFGARLAFQVAPEFDYGLDGVTKRVQPVQLILRGKKARPVQ